MPPYQDSSKVKFFIIKFYIIKFYIPSSIFPPPNKTMVLSRLQAKDAFNYILDEVLGHGDGTPLKTSLLHAGVEDIFGLLTLDNDDINSLTYPDLQDMSQHIAVPKGNKNLLHVFCHYVFQCDFNGLPIGDDWTSITQADFDSFHMNPNTAGKVRGTAPIPTSTTSHQISKHNPVTTSTPTVMPIHVTVISGHHVMENGELNPVTIPAPIPTFIINPGDNIECDTSTNKQEDDQFLPKKTNIVKSLQIHHAGSIKGSPMNNITHFNMLKPYYHDFIDSTFSVMMEPKNGEISTNKALQHVDTPNPVVAFIPAKDSNINWKFKRKKHVLFYQNKAKVLLLWIQDTTGIADDAITSTKRGVTRFEQVSTGTFSFWDFWSCDVIQDLFRTYRITQVSSPTTSKTCDFIQYFAMLFGLLFVLYYVQ